MFTFWGIDLREGEPRWTAVIRLYPGMFEYDATTLRSAYRNGAGA